MERRGIQILFVTVFLVALLMSVCRTEVYDGKDTSDLAGHGIEEIVNTEIGYGTEEKQEEPTEEFEAAPFEAYSFLDTSLLDRFIDGIGDEWKGNA